MSQDEVLEFRHVSADWERPLSDFFEVLEINGYSRFFHPHPFTRAEATKRCAYSGRDLYYIAVLGRQIIGYGILRGWDEGYDVPSLGIAIHPQYHGRKLGSAMMQFLHSAAKVRGAKRIRLKVYKANTVARTLYEHLGYELVENGDSELIGYYDLPHGDDSKLEPL